MILAILAGAFVLAAWHFRHEPIFRPESWKDLVDRHPLASPVLFVPVYALAVAFLLPTLPLNAIAGALWGPLLGSLLALSCSLLGAVSAFLVARGALGQPLAKRFGTPFAA